MPLPDYVMSIGRQLSAHGHTWYVVGGCVRDHLLGLTPKDYDMCTSATPQQIMSVFDDYDLVLDGVKHGTVTVIIDHIPVEITTYRIETGYSDNRHPEAVVFTDRIEEDLKRRDFTVNAMAYNPDRGLVDLFGGQAHLKEGVISCVGNAADRFGEDALRMLRCLRFAARFDFTIEDSTASALRNNFYLLKNIAAERICAEIQGFLAGKACKKVALQFENQIKEVFAPLTIDAGSLKDGAYDFDTQLYLLLHQNDADAVRTALKNMRFAAKTADKCANLISCGSENERVDQIGLMVGRYGIDFVKLWLALKGSDTAKASFIALLHENLPTRVQLLRIRGNDLIALGVPAGPMVGQCLQHLLVQVLQRKVPNEKKALSTAAKQWYDLKGENR